MLRPLTLLPGMSGVVIETQAEITTIPPKLDWLTQGTSPDKAQMSKF